LVSRCALQEIEVTIELAVGDQDRAEALDRHIGERIEPVENDPVSLTQHAPVLLLEFALRRRRRRSLRVIDGVEHEAGLRPPIP
jgi:hypothetical protein